jgi:hypothetical protein
MDETQIAHVIWEHRVQFVSEAACGDESTSCASRGFKRRFLGHPIQN